MNNHSNSLDKKNENETITSLKTILEKSKMYLLKENKSNIKNKKQDNLIHETINNCNNTTNLYESNNIYNDVLNSKNNKNVINNSSNRISNNYINNFNNNCTSKNNNILNFNNNNSSLALNNNFLKNINSVGNSSIYKNINNANTLNINYSPNIINKANLNNNLFQKDTEANNNALKNNNGLINNDKTNDENVLLYVGESPSKRWGHTSVSYDNKVIVYGGRQSYKSLSSMYCFDYRSLSWSNVNYEGEEYPSSRDSHSALVYNNSMYIFGGNWQGKRMSDLWKYDFLLKRWMKITCPNGPKNKEGHVTSLINNNFMVIQGGLDENNLVTNEFHLFDLNSYKWFECDITGNINYSSREGRSCVSDGESLYMFGGEVSNIYMIIYVFLYNNINKLDNTIYNDLFKVRVIKKNTIDDNNNSNKEDNYRQYISEWTLEEPIDNNKKPPVRSCHSCTFYKPDLLIISGGENRDNTNSSIPLNDIWIYSISEKVYYELNINKDNLNSNININRMLHSTSLVDNIIVIFGGMTYKENIINTTLILSLDGNKIETDNNKVSDYNKTIDNNNNNEQDIIKSINNNQEKLTNTLKDNLTKNGKYIVITHNLSYLSNVDNNSNSMENINNNSNTINNNVYNIYCNNQFKKSYCNKCTDTDDFDNEDIDNFNKIKKNYLNTYLSWKFIKEQSKYYSWPLSCILTFINNSFRHENESSKVSIDYHCFDLLNSKNILENNNKFNIYDHNYNLINYIDYEKYVNNLSSLPYTICNNIKDKILCLSVKDNGIGIDNDCFNSMLCSFKSYNILDKLNKENNIFKEGMNIKFSALRLCNSLFIISKTDNYLSFGLISKNIQNKIEEDMILTPLVNCYINKSSDIYISNNDCTNKFNSNRNKRNNSEFIDDMFFNKYVPQSLNYKQCLNIIFDEVKFIFKIKQNFYEYLDNNIITGTHVFLYDLNQIAKCNSSYYTSSSNNLKSIYDIVNYNKLILSNYELSVDSNNFDIVYTLFNKAISTGGNELVDSSLKNYLNLYYLETPKNVDLYLLGEEIKLDNPYNCIYKTIEFNETIKETFNLKLINNYSNDKNNSSKNIIKINGENYKGFMLNNNYINEISQDEVYYKYFNNDLVKNNGILIYKNNTLVNRHNQRVLGDYFYFLSNSCDYTNNYYNNFNNNYEDNTYKNNNNNNNLFKINGFIEIKNENIQLMPNKNEFSEMFVKGILTGSINKLIKSLSDNKKDIS